MQHFFRLYPDLAPVDFIGDGHSCQFIAVGQAACGSPIVAGGLRKLAIEAINQKWEDIGAVVMSEVSEQSGLPLEKLSQQTCLELLAGSETRKPLWGNHCTLSQLPEIVKKTFLFSPLPMASHSNTCLNWRAATTPSTSAFYPSYIISPSRSARKVQKISNLQNKVRSMIFNDVNNLSLASHQRDVTSTLKAVKANVTMNMQLLE